MLKDFINLWLTSDIAISLSKTKIFKNKNLILSESKIRYLGKVLEILKIFVKTTTKLQAEVHPTIYYTIPEIYAIYSRLERVKAELNISIYFLTLG
jgi:hypothetical protein